MISHLTEGFWNNRIWKEGKRGFLVQDNDVGILHLPPPLDTPSYIRNIFLWKQKLRLAEQGLHLGEEQETHIQGSRRGWSTILPTPHPWSGNPQSGGTSNPELLCEEWRVWTAHRVPQLYLHLRDEPPKHLALNPNGAFVHETHRWESPEGSEQTHLPQAQLRGSRWYPDTK